FPHLRIGRPDRAVCRNQASRLALGRPGIDMKRGRVGGVIGTHLVSHFVVARRWVPKTPPTLQLTSSVGAFHEIAHTHWADPFPPLYPADRRHLSAGGHSHFADCVSA